MLRDTGMQFRQCCMRLIGMSVMYPTLRHIQPAWAARVSRVFTSLLSARQCVASLIQMTGTGTAYGVAGVNARLGAD